jgi:hypothetical protein
VGEEENQRRLEQSRGRWFVNESWEEMREQERISST